MNRAVKCQHHFHDEFLALGVVQRERFLKCKGRNFIMGGMQVLWEGGNIYVFQVLAQPACVWGCLAHRPSQSS
eukprot:834871-Pelagomonas_calceolata.AAC.2